MTKQVKIRIRATAIDLVLAEKYQSTAENGCFTDEDGHILPLERLNEACEQRIGYTVTGELSMEGARYTLRYTEPADLGLDNCTTLFAFSSDTPSIFTMIRTGDVRATFHFDANDSRQLCTYETPIMPVEFTVITRKVRNTVTEKGGAVVLDYLLEVRGINTERNRLFIEVEPL